MTEFQIGTLSSTPVVASNFVGDSDSIDTYSFTLDSTGNINLALTGLSSDADVEIFRDFNSNGIVDAEDTQVGGSFRGGSTDDSINIASQEAGDYIVEVNQFSGDTTYDLRLSTTFASSASNLLPSETEVGSLTDSLTFSNSVSDEDTTDIYNFIVDAAGDFTFTLDGLTADADLRLIQDINSNLIVDEGEVIATSTFGSTSTDSITAFLEPGDNYYVQVYQFSSGTIDYDLTLATA